ncbi:ATP-binding protein [Bacteroides stercorirosoris]|uniref:PAS domain-containing hybrid sensor histidine kinase/response regulator n=1 Tax=Bacteroides stercorirosoris TaxID=871324 RepID=UPI0023F73240|nr:ATP-binding protein [Bacteroides stercorirosoris]
MAQDKIKMHESLSATVGENESLEQIKENFLKVKSVLAAHQIALWEINIVTLECTFTEEYFASLGLDKVGIHFRNLEEFFNFVHPDDKHLVSFDGFQQKLEGFEEATLLRIRCVGAHGEIVWLEDRLLSVETDGDGKPERLLCYTVNVTEQCEREAHILRIEERNRKIIEALPEFIFILDDNFFITDVLMSSDTVLLHPVNQLKGADGRSIYSPEVSDLFLRNIHQCLEDGQLKEIEYPLDVDNCERHYFQARISPFEGNKVMALIHDIGDRVQRSNELIEAKQRAEEADRMKSVFLANMSHEIRTPLNAIVGFSEIIALTEDEKEKAEYLNIIQKNSNLLLQLINDILDLSRIESGKSEMNIQLTEMTGLIDEVEKVHRLKMKTGIRFEVVRPDEEIWIMVDRNRITQVLFNFLSNAIKNTCEGSITLGLATEGEWLKVYVTDTGCGIPREKLPLIFNRFEKLNDFVQGTGLGLPICQSIVERLGGKISVESEVGVGSTFVMTLPYQQSLFASDAGAVGANVTDMGHRVDGRKKILIAEDTESNFMQINILLKKDYTISWVTNGEEAVNSFLRERPDLILMDIRMPVMNGIQATEKIRAITLDLPIVAVTANAFLIEQQQALAAGCNDIIAKPYTYEKLKETIIKYI